MCYVLSFEAGARINHMRISSDSSWAKNIFAPVLQWSGQMTCLSIYLHLFNVMSLNKCNVM